MVEVDLGEFDLDEFHDIEDEEKHHRGVVEVVDETQGTEGKVEHVLAVVVHEDLGQVLLVELGALQHTQQTHQRCQEGRDQGESDVEGTYQHEDQLEDSLDRVANSH